MGRSCGKSAGPAWLLSIPNIPARSRLLLCQGSSRCLARQSPMAALRNCSRASGSSSGRELFRRLEGPRPLGTAYQLSPTVLTARRRVTEVGAGSFFREERRMVAVTPVPDIEHQLRRFQHTLPLRPSSQACAGTRQESWLLVQRPEWGS